MTEITTLPVIIRVDSRQYTCLHVYRILLISQVRKSSDPVDFILGCYIFTIAVNI